jgi:hypothetical protein
MKSGARDNRANRPTPRWAIDAISVSRRNCVSEGRGCPRKGYVGAALRMRTPQRVMESSLPTSPESRSRITI